MKLVIIESPFAGDTAANIQYLHDCMRDSIKRGEAPYASHMMYTQVLDDNDTTERMTGIVAGLEWAKKADLTAVYTDRGISSGMKLGINNAEINGRQIEYRTLESRY